MTNPNFPRTLDHPHVDILDVLSLSGRLMPRLTRLVATVVLLFFPTSPRASWCRPGAKRAPGSTRRSSDVAARPHTGERVVASSAVWACGSLLAVSSREILRSIYRFLLAIMIGIWTLKAGRADSRHFLYAERSEASPTASRHGGASAASHRPSWPSGQAPHAAWSAA